MIYLFLLPLWLTYSWFFVQKIEVKYSESREQFSRLNARATEDISNQALIRLFAKEGNRAKEFFRDAEAYRDQMISISRFVTGILVAIEVVFQYALPLIIVFICIAFT